MKQKLKQEQKKQPKSNFSRKEQRVVHSSQRKTIEKELEKENYTVKAMFLLTILFSFFVLFSESNSLFFFNKEADDNVIPIEEKPFPVEEKKMSLIMVGDALIHGAIYGDAETFTGYDFKPMFTEVKPIIESYDLAFYNQETILGGKELGLSSYPRFNSPYEVGDAFLDMGFNLVSLATNHTLDRGEQAILNSRSYWNQQHVIATGSFSSWKERNQEVIGEKNGIRYALLSYTDLTNGLTAPKGKEYLVNRYSEETVKNDIKRIQDKVEVILVSMHFGTEYSHSVSDRQREIATYLSSLGVHIVIGTHPHVVEPIEFINNTMVVYSLGNFISAQRGIDNLTGLMASVTIKKTTTKEGIRITLEEPAAELVYTASHTNNGYRRQFKVYPYRNLNEDILPNYTSYYEKFMDIIVGENKQIEKR